MPTHSHFVLTLQLHLLLFALVFAQDARACYFPDGTPAPNDTACSSGAGESVCCGQGFACLEDGVCEVTSFAFKTNPSFNTDINFYRGSCTDQSWSSPSCPQFCLGSQYAMGDGNSMLFCDQNTFCCYGGSCDCTTGFNTTRFSASDDPVTTIGVFGVATSASASTESATLTTPLSASSTDSSLPKTTSSAVPPVSAPSNTQTTLSRSATSSVPLAAATTSSSASASASAQNAGLSGGAKAGIAIGVLAAIAAFVVIGFLFFRMHRQTREISGLKATRQLAHQQTGGHFPLQSSQAWERQEMSTRNSVVKAPFVASTKPYYERGHINRSSTPRELES